MTYVDSTLWWSKIHKKDKRTGFIVSLSIHVFLFVAGSVIFVKTAHYSIQTVPQSIQVDLVEAPVQPKVVQIPPPPKIQEDVFGPEKFSEPKKIKIIKPRLQPKPRIQSIARTEAKTDYFQNPPPPYPQLAKQMRQEGLVMLSVDVDREGMPITVEIQQSSGFRMLDQAALKAVRHWKFQPGRIGDLPVESKVTVPIRFRIEESE